MPAAPYPENEPDRVATLYAYGILDTHPEPLFDRIVEIAAEIFNAPTALISLVDRDRQWFKAAIGMAASETPREHSFCAHAILEPRTVLTIDNAVEDPRFADNALVTSEPNVQFYAGAPIIADNGQPLGTLCVIDRKVRKIDDAGRRLLAKLAATTSAILELRRGDMAERASETTDPLTHVGNRRAFDDCLAASIDLARNGRPCGLLAIDVDGLRNVNETLGPEAGDLLLREVALRLSETARASDQVCRLGGDEFAVIVNGPLDLASAERLAARVMTAFASPFAIDGGELQIRACVGIAVAPWHATSATDLLRAANDALYAAKRIGPGRIMTANNQLTTPTVGPGLFTLEDELRVALRYEAFTLNWQPYFSYLDTTKPVGHEAFLRWTKSDNQVVPPGVFVPIAETTGLIGPLDAWVLRRACRTAARLPLEPDTHIAVNISAFWLTRGELVPLLQQIFGATGFPPERVVLELTERAIVENADTAPRVMATIKTMGVRFALDNCGADHSSLGLLSKLPFDKIKLDRSLVAGLGRDARAEAIARAILDLGRGLGMKVVAEGVETETQQAFLRAAGCDVLQGFLFGRPEALPITVDFKRTATRF